MAPRRSRNDGNANVEKRSKRHHEASSSRTDQMDSGFGYLFEFNEAEIEEFKSTFLIREIETPKSLDSAWFISERFNIVQVLERNHLRQLAEFACPYSEVLVKAFYKNIRYTDGDLISRVCGQDIVVTSSDWKIILGYDFDSEEDTVSITDDFPVGYDRESIVQVVKRPEINLYYYSQFGVALLNVESRILFYVMTHIIFQRSYTHSKVLESDLVVMWALLNNVKVNWRHYICLLLMARARKSKGILTHAYLVQRILDHFNVGMTERKVRPTGWNNTFGKRLFEQCGIHKDDDGIWRWKSLPPPDLEGPPIGNAGGDEGDGGDIGDGGDGGDGGDVPGGADVSLNDIMSYLRNMKREYRQELRQTRAALEMRIDGLAQQIARLEVGNQVDEDEEDDDEEDDS